MKGVIVAEPLQEIIIQQKRLTDAVDRSKAKPLRHYLGIAGSL
jgi:hypothetical protein